MSSYYLCAQVAVLHGASEVLEPPLLRAAASVLPHA